MSLADSSAWMVVPIMLPLLAGGVAFVGGARVGRWLPPLVAVALLPALIGLGQRLARDGPQRYAIGGWGAPLGIDLYLDGLSLLMLGVTLAVGGLVGAYASAYFRHQPSQGDTFWSLALFLWAGLNALFLAADVFNLYVALELLTLSAVPLVALAGGQVAVIAALRYLLFALAGSLTYLLGVTLLYAGYGSLDIVQLGGLIKAGPLATLALALICIGLLIKTAVFPLHGWLPPAHGGAPAPVSALLSALVVKGSFYLLLRLWFQVFPAAVTAAAEQALGLLGAGAILYGSVLALRQSRLKMMVAYSTVAQIGYLLLVFPLAGALAWNATSLHMAAHALAKAALFLAAGNILHAAGHDRIGQLGTIAPQLPLTLFAFGLGGISLMGLPPTGGFFAKWLFLRAALDSGQWAWAVLIAGGGLLTAAYIFRVLAYAFLQPATGQAATLALPRRMELMPLSLALLSLLLGLVASWPLAGLAIASPFAPVRL